MENLESKIKNQLILALKAKDKETVSVLRMLQSEIKNKKIETKKEVSDSDVLKIIKSLVKQRKDSIKSYESGGRDDLVMAEKKEIEILTEYLPEEISDEELTLIVKKALADSGITEKNEMGKAMGASMKVVGERASGDRVKNIVESLLA